MSDYDCVKSLPGAKLAMHTLSERRGGGGVEDGIVIFNKKFLFQNFPGKR